MNDNPYAIRPFEIADPANAEAVYRLQQASYPIEARLIGLDSIPPLHDTPATLAACGETFVGCFHPSAGLVGAVSYKLFDDGRTLDIHRMMVHPDHFRRGLASKLLGAVLSLPGLTRALVSTGTANAPAVALYERFGFQPDGLIDIAPDVTVTKFVKSY
ncbi:GNAT family N-acetyltransferase [Paenibacillus sp.]|uniref:GNAT family N-acetyltransferase n=1 Tax=Paenibacillus sp. TaxID=58172 RepID=UPI002D62B7BD|nr:GNAT family N-acetyltransferase [Paenibacillus sp.]HZG87312.1 GNAT family N-acetyltransferase [Paenibacillus sp.]